MNSEIFMLFQDCNIPKKWWHSKALDTLLYVFIHTKSSRPSNYRIIILCYLFFATNIWSRALLLYLDFIFLNKLLAFSWIYSDKWASNIDVDLLVIIVSLLINRIWMCWHCYHWGVLKSIIGPVSLRGSQFFQLIQSRIIDSWDLRKVRLRKDFRKEMG